MDAISNVSGQSPMMAKIAQIKKEATFFGRIKRFLINTYLKLSSDENQTRLQCFVGKMAMFLVAALIFFYVLGIILLSLPNTAPGLLHGWMCLPLRILGL
jgi:hypothetical protein